MSMELIYTSATKGLKAGTSGFCTVAVTGGMSRMLSTKLEMLSGYEFPFKISDPDAKLSPVNYAHTSISTDGGYQSVLSRIGFSGSDYSGRANKIAHHFLLTSHECLQAGPADVMMQMQQKGLFRTEWQRDPQELPEKHIDQILNTVHDKNPNGACNWKKMAGDSGWAGILAQAFVQNKKIPAYVIFKPGQDILPLFAESLSCLPHDIRWEVCFATYYTVLPAGCNYHWRGILAGSAVQKEIARFPNATVIDLTRPLPAAQDNLYSKAAREGTVVNILKTATPKVSPDAIPQQIKRDDSNNAVDEPAQDLRLIDNQPKQARYLTEKDLAPYMSRPKHKGSRKKIYLIFSGLIIALLLIAAVSYLFVLRTDTVSPASDPNPVNEKDQHKNDAEPNPPVVHNDRGADNVKGNGQPSKGAGTVDENSQAIPPKNDNPQEDPNQSNSSQQSDPNSTKKVDKTETISTPIPPRPSMSLKDIKYREEFIENYEIKKENIKKVKQDPNCGKFNIFFPLENVKIKDFLPFPKAIQEMGIQSELAKDELIITCKSEGGLTRTTLATCVIENDGLRYEISEEVKEEAQKILAVNQKYYPFAKNIVIEFFDENNKVYQCPIRSEKTDNNITDTNVPVVISKPMAPNDISQVLIDSLPGELTLEYNLPLYISEKGEYGLLLERLDYEKTIIDLGFLEELKTISNSLGWLNDRVEKKGKTQNRIDNLNNEIKSLNAEIAKINAANNEIKKKQNRINNLNNEIMYLNREIASLAAEIAKAEKEIEENIEKINKTIDSMPPDKMSNDKKSHLKGFLEMLKKPEALKESFMVFFKDAWDIDVFSCTFKIK